MPHTPIPYRDDDCTGMPIDSSLSDDAILADLGRRIAARRVDLGLTQSDLASRADVGKRTVERIEKGRSVQLSNLVAIFRELDLIEALDHLLPESGPRPMDLLRRRNSTRQRVGSRRRVGSNKSREPSGASHETSTWTWNDEDEAE